MSCQKSVMTPFESKLGRKLAEALYDPPMSNPQYDQPDLPEPEMTKLPPDTIQKRAEFLAVLPEIAKRLGMDEDWKSFLLDLEKSGTGLSWETAWQFFPDGIDTWMPKEIRDQLEYYQGFCEHDWDEPDEGYPSYDQVTYSCKICHYVTTLSLEELPPDV